MLGLGWLAYPTARPVGQARPETPHVYRAYRGRSARRCSRSHAARPVGNAEAASRAAVEKRCRFILGHLKSPSSLKIGATMLETHPRFLSGSTIGSIIAVYPTPSTLRWRASRPCSRSRGSRVPVSQHGRACTAALGWLRLHTDRCAAALSSSTRVVALVRGCLAGEEGPQHALHARSHSAMSSGVEAGGKPRATKARLSLKLGKKK